MAEAKPIPEMKALLDTNILIRHLTGDPPAQAKRATAYLGADHELILTDLVLAEMVYVLESFYETPRTDIARMARALLALPSIAVADQDLLLRAVEIYEVLRLDFAEAYLAALAELSGVNRVASFDRQIDRVQGIQRIEP
ncbi:MAG TPA: PIN domain-containing protein [Thermoanaerobaculia bacterium]|jgi:predicted nucleic-acid-binding protein|nr:PIN domain-containing protein [Thermoanaerobaculia bacterium]